MEIIVEQDGDPIGGYSITIKETKRITDFLEESTLFEKLTQDIRKKYKIPKNGYDGDQDNFDTFSTLGEARFGQVLHEGEIATQLLNLPHCWYSPLAYFFIYNVFFTPERIPLEVIGELSNYNAGGHMLNEAATSLKQGSVLLSINEKLSKTELKGLIDQKWSKIERAMSNLPKHPSIKLQNIDRDKKIAKMKDDDGMTFADIASALSKEKIDDVETYDRINEDSVKNAYHRWKKKLERINRREE